MSPAKPAPAANRLLAALPREDGQRFVAGCEPVELVFAEVLIEPGEHIRYVYFPTESIISQIAPVDGRAGLAVGLIGSEGMLGICLVLGVEVSPIRALVQAAGPSLRMDAALFCREVEQHPVLQHLLKRYLYVSMGQRTQAAACSHFHVVEARLARWLLMTQDRTHEDVFNITHKFLAHILGVRRVGITKAATALRNRKLISYSRGNISILDRSGLQAASCECYAADNDIYVQTMS